MKYIYAMVMSFFFISMNAHANQIDQQCPGFSYGPAPTVQADQYLCNLEYGVAFSYKHKNPIYTVEYLIASHIGNIPRTNDFAADNRIPVQYQDKPTDYEHNTACFGSRCDRGHMTPDEDFSASLPATHQSFLMTNMVPQEYQNNEQIWKEMEMHFRSFAQYHPKGVFIVTGPIYDEVTPNTIGPDKVDVPDELFKVGIDTATGKSIAFLMPNKNIPTSQLPTLVTNLKTIEAKTGIQFNAQLDHNTIANYKDWF